MFPLRDDNSDRTSFPIVNVVLIALNILVFVAFQQLGKNDKFTMAFSTVPAEVMTGQDIVTEPTPILVQGPEGTQQVLIPGLQPTPFSVYITLLTSMFMHGGLAHIAGNLWFLWIFGDNIEQSFGKLRYIAFYLLSGLIASMCHVLLNQSGEASLIPSLGASGAISGVMGAYLVLHPQRRVTVLMMRFVTEVPGFMAVGLWFVFQIVNGLGLLGGGGSSGVAYAAHIGGFIAGAALAIPFCIGRPDELRHLTWRRGTHIQP